jgi:IMP dehydrogenase
MRNEYAGNLDDDITFSDIAIESQYTDVTSRSTDVDITSSMGKFSMRLPVFSANMPDITEWKMAREMTINGGVGILHRFMSLEENVKQYKKAKRLMFFPLIKKGVEKLVQEVYETHDPNSEVGKIGSATRLGLGIFKLIEEALFKHDRYEIGVSVGVKEEEKERFITLRDAGAKIFCIDIAHGHSIMMKNMIQWIRDNSDESITIIAGNVATAEGALDLAEWGADIVKVGIGPGSVCRTRSNTGVGRPQFTAIQEVSRSLEANNYEDVKVIADGGILTTGDISKALIYADAVMVGAVLAGTTETPGRVFPVAGTNLTNRQWYKVYGGSASAENKALHTGKTPSFVEGEMKTVPFKGKAKYLLNEIDDGIRSTFSYSGAHTMSEYKAKVKYKKMSNSGRIESKL